MKFDIGQPDPLFSNLLQMMRERAAEQADTVVYNFLVDGDRQESKVTCAGLDALASRIGGLLQEKKLKGERALLLYPPGIDYIAAFFGCIYGGVIAVPAYPPDPYRLSRTLPRLKSILQDSGAKLILTTQEIRSMAETVFAQDPELARLEWKATDRLEEAYADSWKAWTPKADDLVFLQYTSGSTGSPKGVMLAHRNLLSNLHLIAKAFQMHPDQMGAAWLPPYHDMGLIGGILTPLYCGGRTILMPPLDFLKNPLSWLRMIHRYGAEISGGPNFAFDLCVRKATPEFIQEIDLSAWKLAYSGAEPVRAETLKRFAETFAPSGFKMKSFYPCYGLAEGTLIVSGGKKADPPVLKRVLRKSLEGHRPEAVGEEDKGGLWLVGCGQSMERQRILIVDPETGDPLPEGRVGEIWASGPSIAMGYWNRPEESEKTFRAHVRTSGDSDLPFLRSGDLGFFSDGELYVTGRIKDLIIIRGQNFYPQDLELSIERSDSALRPGCGAVFSVDRSGEEALVVVWEVDLPLEGTEKDAHLEALASKVRRALATHHEILTDAVVFIRKGNIYKTSSGKIQRHACRKAYLEGEWEIIGEWKSSAPQAVSSRTNAAAGPPPAQASQIRKWLSTQIAERMGLNPQDIDPKLTFENFGLDSKEAVNLSGDLETLLGRRFSPTLLWQYPNVEALSNYLGQEPVLEDATQPALVKLRVKPKVAFLFTGQGSQYPGMGLKLYERGGRFREVLEECDQFLIPLLGRSIKRLILGFDSELALLHETAFTQPALFALEIALAEQFKAWGIEPDFVMGHSVGEYVAACVAGIFSKEEGLKLIAERGRLMQELPKVGAMLAARIGEAQAFEWLAPYAEEVSIAAVNGPRSVVFSGKKEKIDALEQNLAAAGIGVQALNVSHAFHSPLMDSILSPFEERARSILFKAPRIPVISNLTGRILEAGEISAAYWRRHLREAVRFSDGIRSLADRGCEIFTELGPKPVLLTMGKRCFDRAPGLWVSTLDSSGEDEKAVLGAVSELYRHGVPVDWKALSGNFRLFNRKAILNLSPEEGRELLCFQIQSHVAKVLGLQPEHLDLAQPLNTMGLDSLMAIEMKNEIESNLKIKLSIATLIKAPNIQELASVLVEELAKPVSP